MKRYISLMIGIICILTLMSNFVNAEMSLWSKVIMNEQTQNVSLHSYYQFLDTSASGIGKNKPIQIKLVTNVQEIPYILTSFSNATVGEVDSCYLSIVQIKNFWDVTNNHIINTTETTITHYYGADVVASDTFDLDLRDRDSLIIDMVCHYNNTQSMFLDSILIGDYDTFFPAYACAGCEDKTIEEITNDAKNSQNIATEELTIYGVFQNVIKFNYQLWLILSWLLKILFLLIAVTFMFIGAYWVYVLIKSLGERTG